MSSSAGLFRAYNQLSPQKHVRSVALRGLADEIGAEFLSGRAKRPATVQLRVGDTVVTLETGSDAVRGTRLRAPFVNRSGFRFLIYNSSTLSEFGKKLVLLQDLDIGHAGIDRRFIVQSARPDEVRELFGNERISDLVWSQTTKVRFGISDDDGPLGGAYPGAVDLLHFHATEEVTDIDRLKALFELFSEILERVTRPGEEESELDRQVARLNGPGGMITTGQVTLWEGGPARHDAVEVLAELGDSEALDPLMLAVYDSDPIIQSKSVFALGEIGDERVIPVLIRLLGHRQGQLKRKLCDDAADALFTLEVDGIADAFERALDGHPEDLPGIPKQYRPDVIEALITALEGPGRMTVSNAVHALSKIGAVEALPELKRRLYKYMLASVKDAYREAISALETRTSLPRPADGTHVSTDTLPKPAAQTSREGSADTLPDASDVGEILP
jgi:hypothetical protein